MQVELPNPNSAQHSLASNNTRLVPQRSVYEGQSLFLNLPSTSKICFLYKHNADKEVCVVVGPQLLLDSEGILASSEMYLLT